MQLATSSGKRELCSCGARQTLGPTIDITNVGDSDDYDDAFVNANEDLTHSDDRILSPADNKVNTEHLYGNEFVRIRARAMDISSYFFMDEADMLGECMGESLLGYACMWRFLVGTVLQIPMFACQVRKNCKVNARCSLLTGCNNPTANGQCPRPRRKLSRQPKEYFSTGTRMSGLAKARTPIVILYL